MKNSTLFFFLVISLCVYSSCQKEEVVTDSGDDSISRQTLNTEPIESYPLDWENMDEIPAPGGNVRMPWQAASSVNIPDEILHDYKTEDGWELLYNTFHEESTAEHLFFTLYNRYRGVVRTYFYTASDSEIPSSYVTNTLSLRGNTSSPVLNFADQTFIDVQQNSRTTSIVVPYQFERSSWYAFEYELAYDERIPDLSFSQLSQEWKIGSINVSTLKMNGNSTGTVEGTIKSDEKDFNSEGAVSADDNSNLAMNFSGEESKDENKSIWKELGESVKDGVKGAIKSGVGGLVKNIFSGIFGLNSDDTQYIKLDINTEIEMSGTLESGHGGGGPNIPFPGYSASPNGVAYDEAPGVFYLTENPEVKLHTHNGWRWDFDLQRYIRWQTKTYTVIPDSYEVKWNPAVTDIADIEGIRAEVVALSGGPTNPEEVIPTPERIGAKEYLISTNLSAEGPSAARDLSVVGVRIAFKVKPKNGSSEVLIVKSFKSEVTETETTDDPRPPAGMN